MFPGGFDFEPSTFNLKKNQRRRAASGKGRGHSLEVRAEGSLFPATVQQVGEVQPPEPEAPVRHALRAEAERAADVMTALRLTD